MCDNLYSVSYRIRGPGGTDWVPNKEPLKAESIEDAVKRLATVEFPTEIMGVPIAIVGLTVTLMEEES